MTNSTKLFDLLDWNAKSTVRVGVYQKHKSYKEEYYYQALSEQEIDEYLLIGEKVESQRKWRQTVWYIAGIIGFIIVVGYFLYAGKLNSDKSQAHYNGIKTPDVCGILKNTSFHTSSIGEMISIAPKDAKTEYENADKSAKCGLYIHIEEGSNSLTTFMMVELNKTPSSNPPKKNIEAEELETDRYPLYEYKNTQNFYSFTVTGGIDPKESTYDSEYNAIVAKLLVLLAGIEFENKLPSNDSVTNLD